MKKNILLNVTGSISAYKSLSLASLLVKKGFSVRFMPSRDALKFIGRASFEGISRRGIECGMFENDDALAHIHIAQDWADLIISYPCSANTINRLAAGLADDIFGAVCLANNFSKPLLIAPAMNTQMYLHPAVQRGLSTLQEWGAKILPCGEGELACGTSGKGRLLEPEDALRFIEEALGGTKSEAEETP